MMHHQTLETLHRLKLTGMADALAEQFKTPDIEALSFEERLGLLVEREAVEQDNRRMKSRLRRAKLRTEAIIEELDFRTPRGLNRTMVMDLAQCNWVRNHDNVIISGPTGIGKTFLACSLAQKACREGFSAAYHRVTRLLQELAVAKGEGRYLRALKALAKPDVLILDDWGLEPFSGDQRRDLLEIMEDRHGRKANIVTSQLPAEKWYEVMGDPTIADAILDRLVHNAVRISLDGPSMRLQKKSIGGKAKKTKTKS